MHVMNADADDHIPADRAPVNPLPAREAGYAQGIILVIAGFLPIMAIIGLAPALPTLMKHFATVPHASVLVPMLLTLPSGCIAFLAPVYGYLADRFGRRKPMLISMAIYGMGGVMPFFADNFWPVVGGRLLIGIGEAGIWTLSACLMADYFDNRSRQKWLTIQSIVGPVLGTGLIAASGLLAAQGWKWPFIVYATAFPVLIASIFFLWEPPTFHRALLSARLDSTVTAPPMPFPVRTTLLICLATMLVSVLYFVQPIHMSLVLSEMGVQQAKIGFVGAIASVAVPVGALLYKATANSGIRIQLALVFGLIGLGMAGIGLSNDYRWATVAAIIQQLGAGMTIAVLIYWAQCRLPAEHRGRGMGFFSSALFIGQFLCPVAVTAVAGVVGGLQNAFVAFGAVALLCAAAFFAPAVGGWRGKRRPTQPGSDGFAGPTLHSRRSQPVV